MLDAIQYVTGGFSLIAFLAAAIADVRLRQVRRDETALERAAATDIPAVLDRIAGRIHVDTSSLTREQKHGLIQEQLRLEAERFRLTLRTGLAGLTAYSVFRGGTDDPSAMPEAQSATGTADARATLEPRSFNLTAFVKATTVAHVSEGGEAILHVKVNGKECANQRVYKNWSREAKVFNIQATCTIPILANTQYEFYAVQDNKNADAHETSINVSYRR